MRARTTLPLCLALALAVAQLALADTLSQRIYRKLTAIHELRDEGEERQALADARDLLDSARLSDFERATTRLLLADLLLAEERYRDAVSVLEAVLREPGLPDARRPQTRFTLGQLYQQVDRPREALALLEDWLRTADQAPARVYFMLAVLQLELERPDEAYRYAEQGRAAAAGDLTRAQFHFLSSVYFQKPDWEGLQSLLVEAVEKFPGEARFWTQLVQVHLEHDRNASALAVLRLADAQGVLTRGDDLVRMAQLMRLQDAPWLAAQVLERGLRAGCIKQSARHRLMLGEAWTAAREYARAYPVLRRVAEETGRDTDWLRLARLYAQNAQWADCRESAQAGLRSDPEGPGALHILVGVCAYETDDAAAARTAFASAAEDRGSRKEARAWLSILEQ